MKFYTYIFLMTSILCAGVSSIEKQNSASYGSTQYYTIICSNGISADVYEDNTGKDDGTICASNTSGINKCKSKKIWSINSAAQTACVFNKKSVKKSRVATIKNKSLVFLSQGSMEDALFHKTSYDSYYLSSRIGGNNQRYFRLKGNTKVSIIKKYTPYKIIIDQYENTQKNTAINRKKVATGEFKELLLVGGFYKVRDKGNNILYVRQQDLK